MKPHHIAAALLFICGGLLAYTIYQKNPDNPDTAIQYIIIFWLFGTIILFYEKLPPWLRLIVVALPVIGVGYTAYIHFLKGNIVLSVITCIALIIVGIPVLNRDKPSVRERLRPWLEPVPYVGIVVSLVSLVVWTLVLFLG